jgi:phosphate transport system substrate-binding protein
MKVRLTVLAGLAAVAVAVASVLAATAGARPAKTSGDTIVGAGSSLVAPLVDAWIPDYDSKTGVKVTYGSVGSGAGIAQITARTVDFGASDAPLTPDQAAACKDCLMIPWALSATTLSYNVKGVPTHLRLSGPVIAGIFLGTITQWDAPAIKALNPSLSLPSEKIVPVFRSDGSGDTYAFTDYLSRVSKTWKTKVGNATSVTFPVGVGGKGNSGVAAQIAQNEGTIGYVSAAYLLPNHLKVAEIKNAAGKFTLPGLRDIAAAAAAFPKVGPNNEMHIVNPPKSAKKGYPLSTYTYVIVPHQTPKAALLTRFIKYALNPQQGQKFGPKLIFAALPHAIYVADVKTLYKLHS